MYYCALVCAVVVAGFEVCWVGFSVSLGCCCGLLCWYAGCLGELGGHSGDYEFDGALFVGYYA